MKKVYIQPHCETINIELSHIIAGSRYYGELNSRRSKDDFWEEEPDNVNSSGRSRSDDFDDEEEDY